MQLKIKKLNNDAVLPTYATPGSNGLDLTATAILFNDLYVEVRTGLSVEIPEGHAGLLFARSSISNKNLVLANSVGLIDSDYRGEIILRFKALTDPGLFKYANVYKPGERVGQLVVIPIPRMEVTEVTEVKETVRGSGGFGSSGV